MWFNFSVLFEQTPLERSVRIVPNLLYDADRYGKDYSDPQRYDFDRFPVACVEPVWVLAKVGSDGAASESRIVTGGASPGCRRDLPGLMLASKYIPAQHNGQSVEGTYVEALFLD